MGTKYTSGKWEFRKWDGEQWPEKRWSVGEAKPNGKAICICPRYDFETEESEANARLIAAAPDMLQSLAVMTSLCRLKYGNLDKEVYEEILKAESVIIKATQP